MALSFPRLILFARYPTPGSAKTRLIPAIGADAAATVHRTLTERTLSLLKASGAPVELHYDGADAAAFVQWLGGDVALVKQPAGDLGGRLRAALPPAPCIFFGADTPDLTEALLARAIAALQTHDVVIGPAEDGGYYLIGMTAPHFALFDGIDWSTAKVLDQTMETAAMLGLDVAILDLLADCDRPEDLARWPWLVV